MIGLSIAITFSTILTAGCGQIAEESQLEAIRNSSNQIISTACNNFDYSNYDLDYNQSLMLTKLKMYDFACRHSLFSDKEINSLYELLGNDDEFYNIDTYNDIYLSDDTTQEQTNDIIDENFNVILDNLTPVSSEIVTEIDNCIIDNEFVDLFISDDEDEEQSNDNDKDLTLPILSYDRNNMMFSMHGKYDNCNFFGIYCSKDACINLYNAFANFANNMVMYSASGSGSPLKLIVQTIKTITAYTLTGATLAAALSGKIATITGALTKLWATFLAGFTSKDVVSIIISFVIFLIDVGCISIIVTMIIYGYLKKGFALGWKIHSWLNWEWIQGDLDE